MSSEVFIECEGLEKRFPVNRTITQILKGERNYVHAVSGVDLRIGRGEIVGLAGESGCGKTTLGKTLIRLLDASSGTIRFDGKDVTDIDGNDLKRFRRDAQVIFQDPFESLNPRRTIYQSIVEPLIVHDIGDENERYHRVMEALERAELLPAEDFLYKYPHQLSGGEKQRAAIARALVLEPEFILADEPVSMVDVSLRAGILGLLQRLNEELDITILVISHDLSVLGQICDRTGIMYLGKVVEIGRTEDVIQDPTHPYAKALITAAPEPDPFGEVEHVEMEGSVPDPIDLPTGCSFKDRCPERENICDDIEPPLLETNHNKRVACHVYYDESDKERMYERWQNDASGES